jgi:hypothetical protein
MFERRIFIGYFRICDLLGARSGMKLNLGIVQLPRILDRTATSSLGLPQSEVARPGNTILTML